MEDNYKQASLSVSCDGLTLYSFLGPMQLLGGKFLFPLHLKNSLGFLAKFLSIMLGEHHLLEFWWCNSFKTHLEIWNPQKIFRLVPNGMRLVVRF